MWGGLADETTGREVDGDTLFPVFSNIKAMTAVALHIQAERGLVDYYKPVAHYWPEFGKHGKDKGTVFDALTHRIGVPLMPVVSSASPPPTSITSSLPIWTAS